VGALHQRAHHQRHGVLPRGASLHDPCRTRARHRAAGGPFPRGARAARRGGASHHRHVPADAAGRTSGARERPRHQVRASARRGVYPLQSVVKLPSPPKRFFLRGPDARGTARVRRETPAREFPREPDGRRMAGRSQARRDLLPQRDDLLRQAHAAPAGRGATPRSKPTGLFFAGHAESLLDQGRHFRLRGQTVYERAAGRGA
jgi:chemotaxis protein methyltransferase CheR